MATAATPDLIGPLLRDWRQRRHRSQLDLALDTGVSARHLSFVETGRSRPSPRMIVRLAEQLDIPHRDRNRLLLAAGYAPLYAERALDDPEMTPVRAAIDMLLTSHEPLPALVVDRRWNMVAGNAAVGALLGGVADHLLEPPVNVLRVSLHPEGMAPRIVNLAEWRAHLLERLERHVALTGDEALRALADEAAGYPAPTASEDEPEPSLPKQDIVAALRLRTEAGELSFFSTVATFGAAVEVTTSELSIESFFPADAATTAALQSLPRG
jgi:transcriptional regulator with XRE-family HTH domain